MSQTMSETPKQAAASKSRLQDFMATDDAHANGNSQHVPPAFFALIRQAKEGDQSTAK